MPPADVRRGPDRDEIDCACVPDVLIYADTNRSPEMRHEMPIGIPDPFLYVERDGARHVVLTSFEIDRVSALPGAPTPHAYEEFGYDDLIEQGLPRDEVLLEVVVNACAALGVTEAVVPWTFPARFVDRLREAGVAIAPELELFQHRLEIERGRAQLIDLGAQRFVDGVQRIVGVLERQVQAADVAECLQHRIRERSFSNGSVRLDIVWRQTAPFEETALAGVTTSLFLLSSASHVTPFALPCASLRWRLCV